MKIRVIVFVLLAVLTILACKFFSHPESSAEVGVVVWLPENYGKYVGESRKVSELERKWLPLDTTNFKKVYVDSKLNSYLESTDEFSEEQKLGIKGYHGLNVTLVVAGSDSRSLHNPEVCLVAQSWSIVKKTVSTLQTDGGELDVMNLYLQKTLLDSNNQILKNEDGSERVEQAIYTFWWVGPHNTTPHLETKTWLSLWNSVLSGKRERWAYPSCMAYANKDGGLEAAQQRIDDFIIKYAPSFQKSLGAKDRDDAIVPYGL